MTPFETRKAKAAKITCQLLVLGIKQLGFVFSSISLLMPNLPLNIFSYPPGSVLIQLVGKSGKPAGGMTRYILKKVITYVANCIVWGINAKRGLVAAIEMILGSLCLTLSILHYKRFGLLNYNLILRLF